MSAAGLRAPTPDRLPLSVVIPAYNREDLIARAVASVLAQRNARAAEIIVVDDCSADATGAVAKRSGATVLRNERNLGEAGARNTGLRAARCDWVAFLDSDDEWLPHHLATVWSRRSGYVVVAASALVTGGGDRRVEGHPSTRPKRLTSAADLLYPANPLPLSGVIAERRVLLELGGFRSLPTGADLDMWIRAIRFGPVLACPEPGYIYHLHDGQVSADKSVMRENLERLVEEYRNESWCTSRLRQSVAVVNRWDTLRARPRNRGSQPQTLRDLAWILRQPARVVALLKLLIWRLRLRRRNLAILAALDTTASQSP